jgi:predicted lipoprotein with Yx(FWY)xxD motif
MKTSTIVWLVIAIVIIGGAAWWLSTPRSASGAVPGDNLTLGQDSNTQVGKFLIGYNGMTLYTYAPDTAGVSNCTGACAQNWPPYAVTSTANLVGESPLDSAKIGTLTRADGSTQITYGGRPLYFYIGDSKSGDTNGQGVGGVWYVAQP